MDRPVFTTNVKRYGSDQPLPGQRVLHAGPLTLVLEGADLRYIRLGPYEVLRRVYVAVRDRNWDTIQPVLSNVRLDAADDRFELHFDAVHSEGPIDFAWHGSVTGSPDGTVTYVMDGEARSTFWKNRIGFCVLHPMACAGAACTVHKSDGRREETHFPRSIAPHQPFDEFQAITHDIAVDAETAGLRAEVRLDGDIFETEDQRNWTDASFKTYSTPLRLPYPVEIQQGTRVRQSFTLSLQGAPPQEAFIPRATDATAEGAVTFTIDTGTALPLPGIGLGLASHGRPLSTDEVEWLRALRLAHLRVDLDLDDPAYDETLGRATREAQALGVPLEIALFLSGAASGDTSGAPHQLAALAASVRAYAPEVARWLVFHKDEKSTTTAQWVELARRTLGDYRSPPGRQPLFGGGTNNYFTELNRGRPPRGALDVVSYSINPQVHAFDNASLTETLEAQQVTLESARQFCGDALLAVSPVTLKPRFNPNATGPESLSPRGLPAPVDPRQMSLFGAGWTVGSLKYLAQGGAASVTYYETTGWRGVMETAQGSPRPDLFPALPGMLFPLYHVLADVGEYAGATVLRSVSSDPLQVDGLVLRAGERGERLRVLLANMSAEPRTVRVQGLTTTAGQVRVRVLDEDSFERATQDGAAFRREPGEALASAGGVLELTLPPYAVARIDGGSAPSVDAPA